MIHWPDCYRYPYLVGSLCKIFSAVYFAVSKSRPRDTIQADAIVA